MKQKIKEALQQSYKNLGLGETAFDGVAALGETIGITDENLALFVQGAEASLKAFQSEGDRIRSNIKPTNPKPIEVKETEVEKGLTFEQMKELMREERETNMAALKVLTDRLDKVEGEDAVNKILSSVQADIFATTEAGNYKSYMDKAWRDAKELYEVGGKKLNSEELKALTIRKFNERCSENGIEDPAKPIDGNDPKSDKKEFKVAEGAAEAMKILMEQS